MKLCTKCNTYKPPSGFHFEKSNEDGLFSWCKECVKICNKEYRDKNKEKIKLSKKIYYEKTKHLIAVERKKYRDKNKIRTKNCNLKRIFNITLDDYNKILKSQNNVCYICELKELIK